MTTNGAENFFTCLFASVCLHSKIPVQKWKKKCEKLLRDQSLPVGVRAGTLVTNKSVSLDVLSSSHVNEVSPVVSHGFVFIASIQKSISKLQVSLYVIKLIIPLRKSVLRIALQFRACHGELSIFVECLLEDRHWPVPCSADGWDTVLKELTVL